MIATPPTGPCAYDMVSSTWHDWHPYWVDVGAGICATWWQCAVCGALTDQPPALPRNRAITVRTITVDIATMWKPV